MGWNSYNLDRKAQKLVLDYRYKGVLNQSHKMRLAVPYGLERFWGEHLRLISKNDPQDKIAGEYWRNTWNVLVEIMNDAEIKVPTVQGKINPKDTDQVREMAEKLWNDKEFTPEDRQITLDVLTQLCDSLVWWTQRYKKKDRLQDESDPQATDEA